MNNTYVAHVRKSDNAEQSLVTHLFEVSVIAEKLASKIGVSDAGKLLGLMHDFGKYSKSFQSYIGSATGRLNPDIDDDYVDSKSLKGKVDHSSAGAQWVWLELKGYGKQGAGELCGQILAVCIASHHSGLMDCLKPEGKNGFAIRMNKADDETNLIECREVADARLIDAAHKLADKALVASMLKVIKKIVEPEESLEKSSPVVKTFNLGFFTRFLFSCLIDADRIDSAGFENPEYAFVRSNYPVSWLIAIDRLEDKLESFPILNPIDSIRRKISEDCFEKSKERQGIYTLTVPTGGGKTLSTLRYALHHANTHKLDRIIYIIPYTSIIEQNAEVIRNAIECVTDDFPWVLEHHSNIEPERQTWHSKLISDNWDSPVVLTTMVQFLEVLFSGGTRGVRRLHQLANSVLVFDEIQTLPINCTHMFCNALNFLGEHANTTSVLCTATQPLLNELKAPEKGQLCIPDGNELVKNVGQLFDDLKRVDIINKCKQGGWQAEEIARLAADEFSAKGSCLIIVNTKAWAHRLYHLLQDDLPNGSIFHLSTNQYPAHRKKLLDEIRAKLKAKSPVLCISTQLIEAGVDIDFASVIRFLAGLDSIAQAAGRCNRNGSLTNADGENIQGMVHVINPDKETIDMLKDIKIGQEKTMRVLGELQEGDLLSPPKIKRYFQYYFFDRAGEMDYPLSGNQPERDDSLLGLLSSNPLNPGVQDRNGKLPSLQQSFMAAGKAFKAIDAPTLSVIVQHGEGKSIVNSLCAVAHDFDPKAYYDLLKKAQQYSVNVFPNIWEKLNKENAIHEIQEEGIYYLDERYYSDEFGLSVEPASRMSSNIC